MTATDNIQVRPLEDIERCIVKRYKKHNDLFCGIIL